MILLISAFWLPRTTGMSYQHLATCSVFALQAQDKKTPSTGGPLSKCQFQIFIQGLSLYRQSGASSKELA
jgi:hypothetical protein